MFVEKKTKQIKTMPMNDDLQDFIQLNTYDDRDNTNKELVALMKKYLKHTYALYIERYRSRLEQRQLRLSRSRFFLSQFLVLFF